MKFAFTIAIVLIAYSFVTGQVVQNSQVIPNQNIASQNPRAPSPAFYTDVNIPASNCINEVQQQQMQAQIDANIAMLRMQNPQAFAKKSSVHPMFI